MTASRASLSSLLLLTALGAGITGCGGSGTSGTVTSITVAPAATGAPADVTAGGPVVPFRATATYSDASTADVTSQATWTTSDATKVSIAAGMASAPADAGIGNTATLTAAFSGAQGTLVVTVVRGPAIGVTLGGDPLAPQEWYLVNTAQTAFADIPGVAGQDLHLANAHRLGLTGAGVKVAIVDSGLEIHHEDLAANVIPGSWNFFPPQNADPTPAQDGNYDGDHGTSVAGIVAMVYGNDVGGMGIAPGVKLNGYNVLADQELGTIQNFVASLGAGTSAPGPVSSDAWIFNQSYGDDALTPVPLDSTLAAVYELGVTTLRNGLGALYVKSAGNGFEGFEVHVTPGGDPVPAPCDDADALGVSCQNPNMEEDSTIPAHVVVGALNASGQKSSYSSAGAAIWVSAPGGEYGCNRSLSPFVPDVMLEPAMVTTDRSGCLYGDARSAIPEPTSSFNRGLDAANAYCNYTNRFNGTSSAAPSTTGAIALLLDARPDLTWRDVKHVLAMTARKVDPDIAAVTTTVIPGGTYVAELAWTENKAGIWFHNWYGFGAVDVDAAVAMAASYTLLGDYQILDWTNSPDSMLDIPDNTVTGLTSSITVPETGLTAIEAVQIRLDIIHAYLSDLAVELTGPGPNGTRSILLNVRNGMGEGYSGDFVLASNAFYGENPAGTWTLKIVDGRATNTGTLRGWAIKIYGH